MYSQREIKNKLGLIKLIVFDIGNTIVDAEQLVVTCAQYATHRLFLSGITSDQALLLDAYRSASKVSSHPHVNRIFSDTKIIRKALNEAGLADDERNTYLFLTFFRKQLRNLLTRDAQLINGITRLRQSGFMLCVVSDGTTVEQYDLLERIGVLSLFDRVFISESIGEEKTSTKLFEEILYQCTVLAEQTLMVGDDIERDMFWAHKTGYTTILQEQYVIPTADMIDRFAFCVDYRVKSLTELYQLITG
jgi:HAD superfamily hydrolase (TIGR01549 family)